MARVTIVFPVFSSSSFSLIFHIFPNNELNFVKGLKSVCFFIFLKTLLICPAQFIKIIYIFHCIVFFVKNYLTTFIFVISDFSTLCHSFMCLIFHLIVLCVFLYCGSLKSDSMSSTTLIFHWLL